jgi:inner membrane protein
MDPVSQAFAGATLSQSLTRKRDGQKTAFLAGALSGMAADLDVFIRSGTDPLLFLEYHRQFTHSLVFIPFGALVCTVVVSLLLRNRSAFRRLYSYCLLGYATHGLLDACTSYGTQLFWPFSHYRVAWDVISIIDPLFTVPVMLLVLAGVATGRRWFPRIALFYGLAYLAFGYVQHERAMQALTRLAVERGHTASRPTVKPTLGNLYLWKLIYEYDGRYYVDAARVGRGTGLIPGESVSSHVGLEGLPPGSTQAHDIERFRWFSSGYIAHYRDDPLMIGDIRYSLLPDEVEPLWGIRLDPDHPDTHARFLSTRHVTDSTGRRFLEMLFGRHR